MSATTTRKKRVVIAGFGDSGLTAAVHLASNSELEIVGITPKMCHASGQELGGRLAQPALWKELYLLPFDAYRQLDRVRMVYGLATRIDLERQAVHVSLPDGSAQEEPYDALLIASGVSSGFWRTAHIESRSAMERAVQVDHEALAAARTFAVVGAGASGVSAAYNVAFRFPSCAVHLFCSGEEVLPGYNPRTQRAVREHLRRAGVIVHTQHRAVLPDGSPSERLRREPIAWVSPSGEPSFEADLVLWAVGHARPNSGFVPAELLDASGFVLVDQHLRAGGKDTVFALGDVAVPSARTLGSRRSSARQAEDGGHILHRRLTRCAHPLATTAGRSRLPTSPRCSSAGRAPSCAGTRRHNIDGAPSSGSGMAVPSRCSQRHPAASSCPADFHSDL